jgi:hypothetical protein
MHDRSAAAAAARTRVICRGSEPAVDDALVPGMMCGEYIVERLLGAGGFARVYAARHRVLGRTMAIKVLDRQLAICPRAFMRFMWEARVASRVRHPHVVDVVDFGRLFDGRPYLVMELLAGESLEDRLTRTGPLAVDAAVAIVDALAAALGAVHAAGIVHRDIKPSNVFLCAGGDHVKLLDFGIAKLVRPDPDDRPIVTTVNTRMGTSAVAAPEAIRGAPVDARTDVYGLGVTLYRMLTARWPYAAAEDTEIERLHLEAEPVPPSQLAAVSGEVDAVVERALAKDPDDRYDNAPSLAAALRTAARCAGRAAAMADRVAADAVACHLEIRSRLPTAEVGDRVAALLDVAGAVVFQHGWALTAQSADTLLAAAASSSRTRGDAAALADALLARVRPMAGGVLEVTVGVHEDRAIIDRDTRRVVGGRITNPRVWPRRTP